MNVPVEALLHQLGFKVDVTVTILTVALLMARLIPLIFLTPVLGGENVPNEVKIGLGIMLAIVLFPLVAPRMELIPTSALAFIALLLKELFLGFALSYIVIGFEAAQMAGALADIFSGTGMAQVHVPSIDERVSLFSSLKVQLLIVVFLTLNGHHVVIRALADSLEAIPLDRFPTFSHGSWPFFDMVIRGFSDLLPVAVALTAPAMLATLLVDIGLGLINRVAPQIQVYFISMSIKPLAATLMVLVSVLLIVEKFRDVLSDMLAAFQQAFHSLA